MYTYISRSPNSRIVRNAATGVLLQRASSYSFFLTTEKYRSYRDSNPGHLVTKTSMNNGGQLKENENVFFTFSNVAYTRTYILVSQQSRLLSVVDVMVPILPWFFVFVLVFLKKGTRGYWTKNLWIIRTYFAWAPSMIAWALSAMISVFR